MNRPKRIGTAAETAVVDAALRHGIPAMRVAQRGSLDMGDVWLLGGRIVLEVKAHARRPGDQQLDDWFAESQDEAARVDQCDVGALVVKRPGFGAARAERWDCHLTGVDYALVHGGSLPAASGHLVRITLGDLLLAVADWCR